MELTKKEIAKLIKEINNNNKSRTYYSINEYSCFSDFKNIYNEEFSSILTDTLQNPLLVTDLNKIIDYIANEAWEEHKNSPYYEYQNLFGNILHSLHNSHNYKTILKLLDNLYGINNLFPEQKEKFLNLLHEYFQRYKEINDIYDEHLQNLKNSLFKMCSKFLAKNKEQFKKNIKKQYYTVLKRYFKPKLENKNVKKTIICPVQKEMFLKKYYNSDDEILLMIEELLKKYQDKIERTPMINLIDKFVSNNFSEGYIKKPADFDEFMIYKKAMKTINRLNSKYIEYDNINNVLKNKIKYNNETQKYFYIGKIFTAEEINEYQEYITFLTLFKKIKRDIFIFINNININTTDYQKQINDLTNDLAFNDTNFEFNKHTVTNNVFVNDFNILLLNKALNTTKNTEGFQLIYDLLVNKKILWYLLIINEEINGFNYNDMLNTTTIIDIISNADNICQISKEFNFDLNSLENILLLKNISLHTNKETLAILSSQTIKKLFNNKDNGSNVESTLEIAKDIICKRTIRHNSTVPFINGTTSNYKYEMYDSMDESILTSGIDTNSCSRINGAANDFFLYTLLNENGFIIKFTDCNNNFVGKASGFRNGNCIFINQLRTIYDEKTSYENLNNIEIIEILYKACRDIIETSQNNSDETNKIDHVFVTKSYSIQNIKVNIDEDITDTINNNLINLNNPSWNDFIYSCENLQVADINFPFTCDYGEYPIICVSSSKKIEELKSDDLSFYQAETIYKRSRNKILVTDIINSTTVNRINKIRAISSRILQQEFIPANIKENTTVFTGDNWYIILENNIIVDYCILTGDLEAEKEFNIVKKYITNNLQEELSNINYILKLKKNKY